MRAVSRARAPFLARRDPFILDHDTTWMTMFLLFTGFIIAIETLLIPVTIAFGIEMPRWYSVAVVLIFAFDICVSFNTSVPFYGQVIRTRKLIAYYYMTHMFLLDVVSTVPWDLLFDMADGSSFSRFPKLTRALRTHSCLFYPRGGPGQAGRPNFGGLVLGCIDAEFFN